MAKLYFQLCKAGTWEIEKVPALWRSEVEAMLAEGKE